jgi:NAD(P)H dehydrogenase (quinone)
MRYLVIYAHPDHHSFHAAIHDCVVATLSAGGHEVDDCDLYAEGFQPVLSWEERENYYDTARNRVAVLSEIERLERSQGLIFVFPTWWYGMPAILKGYFDRVWVPGSAFELLDGRTRPLLRNIERFAVVTTYGSPWWLNKLLLGDPNRKVFMRGIRHLFSPNVRTLWLALYGMDYVGKGARARFLERIGTRLQKFC